MDERTGGAPAADEAARRAIVDRYARMFKGRTTGEMIPELCQPKQDEVTTERGGKRKGIYPDEAAAEAAARELTALYPDEPQRVYPCPRSRTGHYHVSTDNHARKLRARGRRTVSR